MANVNLYHLTISSLFAYRKILWIVFSEQRWLCCLNEVSSEEESQRSGFIGVKTILKTKGYLKPITNTVSEQI